jgi:hypothetical protein
LAPLRADAYGWNVAGAADAKESTAIRETRETEGTDLQNSGVRLLTGEAINEFGNDSQTHQLGRSSISQARAPRQL